jgi:hypothetical protein
MCTKFASLERALSSHEAVRVEQRRARLVDRAGAGCSARAASGALPGRHWREHLTGTAVLVGTGGNRPGVSSSGKRAGMAVRRAASLGRRAFVRQRCSQTPAGAACCNGGVRPGAVRVGRVVPFRRHSVYVSCSGVD